MALWMQDGAVPLTEKEKADIDDIAAIKEFVALELKFVEKLVVRLMEDANSSNFSQNADCRMPSICSNECGKEAGRMLISGYCLVGNVSEAYNLFCEMPEKNVVSWTAVIGGLVRNCEYVEALQLFFFL